MSNKNRQIDNRRIVAVNINQIFNLTTHEHGLVMHRQKIPTVKLVGNIISFFEQKDLKIIYTITDYTGPNLEVVFYLSQNIFPYPKAEQVYCTVYGKPNKDKFGHIYLDAFYIQVLPNLNDLTIHLLEVVHDAKELKKFKIEFLNRAKATKSNTETEATTSFNANTFNTKLTSSSNTKIVAASNYSGYKNSTNNRYDNNNNRLEQSNQFKESKIADFSFAKNNKSNRINGFSEVQNLVINLIREDNSDLGISEDKIFNHLASVNRSEIKAALSFLQNESHIYESENSHYKIAD